MDLLIKNGTIITLDKEQPFAEEVLARDGMIIRVGLKGECESARRAQTKVIDLEKRTMLPGFIDAHVHLRAMAENEINLDISPDGNDYSIAEIKKKIERYAGERSHGQWIRAVGYDPTRLKEKKELDRTDLDPISPGHPVKVTHRSGYAHVLNSEALKKTGINRWTPDPPGGIIERDLKSGEPTGQFYGAGDFLSDRIPEVEAGEIMQGIQAVNDKLLKRGITSVHDASHRNDMKRWQFVENAISSGLLQCRVNMMTGLQAFHDRQGRPFATHLDRERLKAGGVKIILDETAGNLHPTPDELERTISTANKSGIQVIMHAVEPSAIKAACAAVRIAQQRFPLENHRHRIEHCSVCHPDLAKRIAGLGIVVVTNPAFIYHSGDRYLKTVDSRQQPYLYPVSSLCKNGVLTAFGSDAPIADVNPLLGIYAAITRKSKHGSVVAADEAVSRLDALRMATSLPAFAVFEEAHKGTISEGKNADFVVLDANPLRVEQSHIKDIAVDMTIIGGSVFTQ